MVIERNDLPVAVQHLPVATVSFTMEAIHLFGLDTAIGKFVLARMEKPIEVCYLIHKDPDLYKELSELFKRSSKLQETKAPLHLPLS